MNSLVRIREEEIDMRKSSLEVKNIILLERWPNWKRVSKGLKILNKMVYTKHIVLWVTFDELLLGTWSVCDFTKRCQTKVG